MYSLPDMIWIEWRKAVRSGMLLWTGLGSVFLPLGIAFLIFVARNPQVSQKLGLITAKANLTAYAATDWPAYLALFGQLIPAVGLILFVLVVSWVFGREWADGTLKDLLAVPVPRAAIVLAKFILVAAWSAVLTVVIFVAGLGLGALIQLPAGEPNVIVRGSAMAAISAGLTIVAVLPFAFVASAGRGYLPPIGAAILVLMLTNLAVIAGWGDYFPWAVGGLYVQAKGAMGPVSFAIVLLTGLAGIVGTYLWWKWADQNR